MSYLGNQPNSAAFLTDQFSGNGSTTAFTLSTAPAGTTSLLVSVSGVLQDPSTYSVVGTTLTLGGAAPTGTGNISVRYLGIPASGVVTTAYRTVTEFTATAGQTTFTPPSYSVGFIAVYLNGARLGAGDFTASNGTTIVLATGASVDDLVVTESFYISSVANAIPNIPNSVVESNIGSGAVTSSKIADNSITTEKIAVGAVVQADLAVGVSGTGPAFSAYATTGQTLSGNVITKILFNSEEFDTNNNFASSRFTPTIAGYYFLMGHIQPNNTYTAGIVSIYKNGSVYKYTSFNQNSTGAAQATGSCLMYMNGSTDYAEFYASFVDGQPSVGTAEFTWFQGYMVRAA